LLLLIAMIHPDIKILLLVLGLFSSGFQTNADREAKIKAAFLFNFTQFVQWPEDVLSTQQEPLVIGVLGENPFGDYLKDIVAGEKVNGHPLVINYYRNAPEINTCHILFINLHESGELREVFAHLKSKGILTVGDGDNFIKAGGMVRFFKRDNKIRMEINAHITKAAGLIVSSKLLQVADVVSNKK